MILKQFEDAYTSIAAFQRRRRSVVLSTPTCESADLGSIPALDS